MSKVVYVAVLTGLDASLALSTLPTLTIDLAMIPLAVPVIVSVGKLAFSAEAVDVVVLTGLGASEVLSTLPKPTIDLAIPLTVPQSLVGDRCDITHITRYLRRVWICRV